MRLSFNDQDSFKEAVESLRFNHPISDPDTLAFQRVGSGSSLPIQERNEDICFINPPSDPDTLQRVGSSSSMSHQEEIEVT